MIETADWMFCDIPLNVLGYRDDGEWIALALDMDLRGYGETFEVALEDLIEHVQMQIGFSLDQGKPGLVSFPADPVYYQLFAETRAERLRDLTAPPSSRFFAGGVSLPPAHVIAAMEGGFTLAPDA